MEGELVHCGVCGEEVKTAPSNQENGQTSPLLQSYLMGMSCHFQEEINFGDLEGLIACDGCRLKINSLQIRKEWFEGLRKEVSEAERNLHRKITDAESVGLELLGQAKELEKLIKDRIQMKNFLSQRELFLRIGSEKDSVALKGSLKELKEKQNYISKWTGEIDAGNDAGTSSSSDQESWKILSVTSLAVVDQEMDGFEASEVFQVRTEPVQSDEEDHNDNASTGVPVPECVVKVEDEVIRTTRHRVIYGNRKVRIVPFEALPNQMLQTGSNQDTVEYETIDLENEEAEASIELSRLHDGNVGGDNNEEWEEGAMSTMNLKKRAIMEVDRDQMEIHAVESRHKVTRRNNSPGSHKLMSFKGVIEELNPNRCSNESSGLVVTAQQSRLMPNGGTTSQDETNQESATAVITDERRSSEPSALNKIGNSKPAKASVTGKDSRKDMGKEETEKWFADIMSLLGNSNDLKVNDLRKRFLKAPKLSPDRFHKLVVKLKKVDMLKVFNDKKLPYYLTTSPDPTLYRIIKNVEVEQHTLDILYEAGINFNVLNVRNRNLLFAAIEGKRSIVLIKNLIKRGINVNHIDCTGQSLLSFASWKGSSLEMLEFIIKEGAGLKGLDKGAYQCQVRKAFDLIPSMKARLGLLKALVNNGDDIQGKWALEQFLIAGHQTKTSEDFHDLVQYIFSSTNRLGWFDIEDEDGVTLLHWALYNYEISKEAFEMLVIANCNFKKVDKQGRDTLYYAIRGGRSVWVLEALIEQGADVNIRTATTPNLLHSAVTCYWNENLETFQFLIDKGVDITVQDSDGYTVLERALKLYTEDTKVGLVPNEKVFTSLFIWSFNAGLRHLNKKGVSLVRYVVENGNSLALNHILERASNFDINELDKHGLTMFERAICSTNKNVVENAKALVKYGADVHLCKGQRETAMHHLSVQINIPEALRFCVEELGLDVNAADKDGMTPLLAIFQGNFFQVKNKDDSFMLEKVKILLENGANVNAKTNPDFFVKDNLKLQTPLHLALYAHLKWSRFCTFDIIKLLVMNGANVNEPTLEGWTPIHLVMAAGNLDHTNLIRLTTLFGDRVDYSAKTRKGQTALHLAAESKNIDSIRFCLEKGLDVNDLDEEGKTSLDLLLPDSPQYVYINTLFAVVELLLKNGATSQTKRKFRKEVVTRWNEARLNFSISKGLYNKFLGLLK